MYQGEHVVLFLDVGPVGASRGGAAGGVRSLLARAPARDECG